MCQHGILIKVSLLYLTALFIASLDEKERERERGFEIIYVESVAMCV